MNNKIIFTLLAFYLCAGAYACGEHAAISLTVDTASPAQEILGFGASGCWWAQEAGGLPEAQRREIMRLLYDKKDGIGLTIYRHNLGADTLDDPAIGSRWHRAESMLDTKTGRYDWTRDASARRIMREAVDAGAEQVILFVNSPPVSMTINGHGRCTKSPDGKPASNLAPERYGDFAAYLGEITEHFLRVDKLPVVAVSPINEPGDPWDRDKQEGCFYTPPQAAGVLKALLAEFKRRGLPVRVEAPENGTWNEANYFLRTISRDPVLRAGLTDYCVHSYGEENGSSAANKRQLREWFDKNWPGLRLHMSEWVDLVSPGNVNARMADALPMARMIIEDITIGGVSTWQWWLAASHFKSRDGLVYYDIETHAVAPNKRYWVMGQFSRYLPKGSVVLPVSAPSPDAQVSAMAARLPDGRVAVVCANLSEKNMPLNIKFPQNEAWRRQLRALTDENNNNNTAAADAGTLPAKSVVTIIFQQEKSPPAAEIPNLK